MSQNPQDDEIRPEGGQPQHEAPRYQVPGQQPPTDQQRGDGSGSSYGAPSFGSQQQASPGQGDDAARGSGSGSSAVGSSAAGGSGYGQPSYGDSSQSQSPYSQPSHGQQGYGQSGYGQSGEPQASSYGQAPQYDQTGYGQAPAYGGPQQASQGAPGYGQAPAYGGQQAAPQYGGGQTPQYQPTQAGGQWNGAPATTTGAPGNLKRLRSLLIASAVLFLLLALAQIIGRTTMAYARSLQDAAQMYEGLGIPMSGAQTGGLAFGVSNIISWVVTLALYALVFVLLTRAPGPARILGIILAILGSIGALFAFISAFAYGWAAILVILAGLAFIVVNIMWIVQAVKTKPATR
ncbi:hypothetical protein [Kocuria palustris]|uniref:hypothetical protein n=1 Tax=Kocuria palustris TaxID=71999 RepID=UPI0011A18BA6|nr:hypothetical protein [Kocuria palustris]